jgi:hypothetical protein
MLQLRRTATDVPPFFELAGLGYFFEAQLKFFANCGIKRE